MKKRQEPSVDAPDEVDAPDKDQREHHREDQHEDSAAPIAVASSFDAAQALLQEALAGFSKPAARAGQPDHGDQHETPEHRQWRRRLHEDDHDHAQPEADTAAQDPSRSAPDSEPVGATWSASAAASAAAGAAVPADQKRSSRRKPSTSENQSSTSTPTSDEFDGLTETLYEKPARGTPRRRRPVEAAAAVEGAQSSTLSKAELPPTITEPDPSIDVDAPSAFEPVAAGLYAHEAADSSRSKKRTAGVLAVIAAALVGVIVIALALSGGGSGDSNEPALRAGGQAELTFDPITTPEGVNVTRVWALSGAKGTQFEGELEFSNPTSAPIVTNFTEVIPKSLARSVTDITFDPEPIVVQADPVVRYALPVAVGATVIARYEIRVPPEGVRRARLDAWAEELGPITTTPPTTPPTAPPVTPTPSPGTTPPATAAPTPRPTTPSPTTPPPTAAPDPAPPLPPVTDPPAPPVQSGTVVIRVVSLGATGTFDFSGSGFVSLTTVGAPNGVAETAFTVAPGLHPWTQATTPGFRLRPIDCTDRDSGPFEERSTVSGSTATFNVQPGEIVVCTYTNNQN